MTRFLSDGRSSQGAWQNRFRHYVYPHREAELLDPTAEEGARTKAAKPSKVLGFAFLLLTACDMARSAQAPTTELVLISNHNDPCQNLRSGPSIPRNDRAAPVEAVVDASLHRVLVQTVTAKRSKSDRRNEVGVAKIIILILNFC